MKIQTPKFKKAITSELLEAAQSGAADNYGIESPSEELARVYVAERLYSEMIKGHPHYKFSYTWENAAKNWVQGLALNVIYSNYDIIRLFCASNEMNIDLLNDQNCEDIVEFYWDHLAQMAYSWLKTHFNDKILIDPIENFEHLGYSKNGNAKLSFTISGQKIFTRSDCGYSDEVKALKGSEVAAIVRKGAKNTFLKFLCEVA